MKIKQEDYNELKKAINIDSMIKALYKKQGASKERFAWDMLHTSLYDTRILYKYLDDSHIQTALFKIVGEY